MPSKLQAPVTRELQPEATEYQATLEGYGSAKRLLNCIRTWKGLNTRSHWTGPQQEIDPFQQALILESLYRLLEFYTEDGAQAITKGQVYRWIADALQQNPESLAGSSEQGWQQWIHQTNALGQPGSKGLLDAVDDMLLNPNPVIWLELRQEGFKKRYYIRTGPYAEEFHQKMQPLVSGRDNNRSFKAPAKLPTTRPPSGRLSGTTRYAELAAGSETEGVLQILESRHLWLRPNAYSKAEQMTAADSRQSLKPVELAVFFGKLEGYLNSEKRMLQRKCLRRQALLAKLQDFPVDAYSPLHNRYYSQSSGRIQSRWLHPSDVSEKAGCCDQYPGGVRQAIFCADDNGLAVSTSDCNASAWQLASLLLGDENTQAKACGPNCDFNTEMTQRAIHGNYFVAEKLQDDEGKAQARYLVKKLLMTVLYGSSASQQYLHAKRMGLGGYWQEPISAQSGTHTTNGAHRFLKDHESQFPVLKQYVPLMQKVASIGCQHLGTLTLPYIFEVDAWLNFDHPQTREVLLKRHRKLRNGKRKDYSVTLQLPVSLVENGRFVRADPKEVKRKLPPTVIHSIESAVIKTLIVLLDQALPSGYGFATIHDCVLFPQGVIQPEQIQQLWNESLRIIYQKLGPLLQRIVEILALDSNAAGQYLPLAQQAWETWQGNVQNPAILDRLWLSTSMDY